jgi:hypothetical protein
MTVTGDYLALYEPLTGPVMTLLAETSLRRMVVVATGKTGCTTVWPGPIPPEAWSTGERLLWDFLCSINGGGKVSLGQVCDWFAHDPSAAALEEVFATALGRRT